mmetsp:Transcript_4324/g.10499  ORF Transcript_4324/g.10499 Transcript_4324/m.10499 type:complete len:260 (-) Transcript_4324:83-862(-)
MLSPRSRVLIQPHVGPPAVELVRGAHLPRRDRPLREPHRVQRLLRDELRLLGVPQVQVELHLVLGDVGGRRGRVARARGVPRPEVHVVPDGGDGGRRLVVARAGAVQHVLRDARVLGGPLPEHLHVVVGQCGGAVLEHGGGVSAARRQPGGTGRLRRGGQRPPAEGAHGYRRLVRGHVAAVVERVAVRGLAGERLRLPPAPAVRLLVDHGRERRHGVKKDKLEHTPTPRIENRILKIVDSAIGTCGVRRAAAGGAACAL